MAGEGALPDGIAVDRAAAADIDRILELQAADQPERGGTLSGSLPRERIAAMIRDMPTVVARRGGRVVGYLMASSKAMNGDVPIVRAMLDSYPGAPDAYVYGPIVVAAEERGSGVARAMFDELRRRLPGREGILFIRRDNAPSQRAHARMGMRKAACFVWHGAVIDVLAYTG
jgi:predicted GNAT superfamily acetyltransferase